MLSSALASQWHDRGNGRILLVSAGFEPGYRGGGPIRSVTGLVDDYAGPAAVLVVTRDRDLGARAPYPGLSGRAVRRGLHSLVFYMSARRLTHWVGLIRLLTPRRLDVLYVNSFFSPLWSFLPLLAVALRLLRPSVVVLAPRGELMPGAMQLKQVKKRLFLVVWRPLFRRLPVVIHATSPTELDGIRSMLPGRPAIILEVAPPCQPPPPTEASHPGPLRACFVGRVSPKKNLLVVLDSLGSVRHPVQFDIFGPIEDASYWALIKRAMLRLPLDVTVTYRGELQHSEVTAAFASHDLFVFPTQGENFGHVIAESLHASCPVICSPETPWTAVLEDGGGEIVQPADIPAITAAVNRWAAMTPDERTAEKVRAGAAYRRWLASRPRTENILDWACVRAASLRSSAS